MQPPETIGYGNELERLMKHIKYIFSLLVIVFAVATVQAQDAKADKILADSKKTFKSKKDLTCNIKFSIENPRLDEPQVKTGTAKMSGDKYQIKFENEHVYCDGKSVWLVLMEEEEVTITEYDPEESMNVDMVYKIYEEDTKSRYDGLDGDLHKISLFWNHDKSDFFRAELWINKSTKLIQNAVLSARNGSKFIYSLTNIKTNTGVPASEFTPNLVVDYKGFYVEDDR